jgi:hypothetical protein
MKKPLAVQLEFDVRTVRRALALLTGEAMSDEEIVAKFFDREAVKFDIDEQFGEVEAFQMCAAMLAVIMAEGKVEQQPEKKRSAFQKRVEEMMAERAVKN